MKIRELIPHLIEKHLDGDPKRFEELWDLVPDLSSKLRKGIELEEGWIYLKPETFDGWYLIKHNEIFELYYQERGGICWGKRAFNDEKSAFAELLRASGCLVIE